MITPDEVHELPHQHIGRRLLIFNEIGSTNDIAMSLANVPGNAGVAILARTQTAGRGQHGRRWLTAPRESITLSVLLFPPERLRRPAIITAWAAVSVAELVNELLGEWPVLKWPNDVLFRGQKVCGILAEQGQGTVVGIGLNVNQTAERFVEAGLPDAASLAMFAEEKWFVVEEIVTRLLGRLDVEYGQLLAEGTASLEERWREGIGLVGRPSVVECHDGSEIGGLLTDLTFDNIRLESVSEVRTWPPEAIRHIRGG